MPRGRRRLAYLALASGVLVTLAAVASKGGEPTPTALPAIDTDEERAFPPSPAVPSGPLATTVVEDLDVVFGSLDGAVDLTALERLGGADDARIAWLLADLLRFTNQGSLERTTRAAWENLTGVDLTARFAWGPATDHLLTWDVPAPPDYVRWKRQLFELVEPGWAPFFADGDADIDWRWISWGGVLIDDRSLDRTDAPCPDGCIPALNDPAVTSASEGGWYPDDAIVFGIEVDGEAIAFPKNIMEVHEMVNLTVSGRRVGMPYCTLCGSAQAYLTDVADDEADLLVADHYELRTSGLLSRSNKVMYEFHTQSVFDTFTGVAVSGPLREAGVQLEQLTVVTSSWGEWKAAHPQTTIIAEDGGIGRSYDADPLRGRDDAGPIFPIGEPDPRLPVHESVIGVVLDDGTAVAFPTVAARVAIENNDEVRLADVQITADGGGFVAIDASGEPLATHEAFWFAWSQFHPETLLWAGSA